MNSKRFDWKKLNHLQLGKYAEYYVKMEFIMHGFDLYTVEVDCYGIDFVVHKNNQFYKVQVKSARNNNYIFFPEKNFKLHENLLAAVVYFHQEVAPEIYLVPSLEWATPNALLTYKTYEGLKSNPEYGINASLKNKSILTQYVFEKIIRRL